MPGVLPPHGGRAGDWKVMRILHNLPAVRGAPFLPSWSVTDQTSTPTPPPAQIWQCGFCEVVNVSDDPDPLCKRCGLARARRTPQPANVAAPLQPELQAPPVGSPKARRPRKKRDKHRDAVGEDRALRWLHGTVEPAPIAPQAATPIMSESSLADRLPTPASLGFPTFGADDIEATRIAAPLVSRATPPGVWLLVFETGSSVALPGDDVVVGRQPEATEPGVATLQILDPLKELSRTHARLRRDATHDTWTIEDLDSANGVATVDATGETTFLTPRQAVAATEYLLIGRHRVKLARLTQTTPHPLSQP